MDRVFLLYDMDVKSYSDLEWDKILLQHTLIAVNYETPFDSLTCRQLSQAFVEQSNNPEYKGVLFLRIDSRTNPVAEKFIRKNNLPFAAIFKSGILLECNILKSKEQLIRMLDRLIKFQLTF